MLNSKLLAAMQEPLLVDTKGRLLALRGNGATMMIEERTIYRGAGMDSRYSWIATNSGVAVLRSDGRQWSHEFHEQEARHALEPMAHLPVAFSVTSESDWALIWTNGSISYCLLIDGDDAVVTACKKFRACDAQWKNGVLNVVGLYPRSGKIKKGVFSVSELGIGQLRRVTRSGSDSTNQEFKSFRHELFVDHVSLLKKGVGEDFPPRPYPEAIVAVHGELLVVQYTVPQLLSSEDADLLSVEPDANEAEGLAVCVVDEDFSVKSVHHGLAYIGSSLVVEGCKYLYGVRKNGSWGGIEQGNIIRMKVVDQEPGLTIEAVSINLLPSDQLVRAAKFSVLPFVGYVGCLETTVADDRTSRRSWLLKSEDGIVWTVSHDID